MGLPINKIYVATNSNDIMHRTISNGDMSLKDVETVFPQVWIYRYLVILRDNYLNH